MEEQNIIKEIHKLDVKLDVLTEKVEGTFNLRLQDHEKRIGNIEGYIKWGVLLVMGSVLTSLIGLIMK